MEKQRLFCAGYWLGTTLLLGGGLVSCSEGGNAPDGNPQPTPYITKVLEFVPAPGQFVNALPAFNEGDSQETMNQKVLELIGHNKRGLVSLGGYGGYVIVGFDHTIENKAGKPDFRVLGNAFNGNSSAASSGTTQGGSYEPGIIRVRQE
mgnify:FL=1